MMPDTPSLNRILVLGNAGSGKTWLARQLAPRLAHPVVHLDDLQWQQDRYGVARDKAERDQMTLAAAAAPKWIMEGVYGHLANLLLPHVTTFIWLDLPEAECITNIRARGIQGDGSATQFETLLQWVADYRLRLNHVNSFEYHQRLFDRFARDKVRLTSRGEMVDYLGAMMQREPCGGAHAPTHETDA